MSTFTHTILLKGLLWLFRPVYPFICRWLSKTPLRSSGCFAGGLPAQRAAACASNGEGTSGAAGPTSGESRRVDTAANQSQRGQLAPLLRVCACLP
eukprot:212107-Pleurochrysis_carterae.AAC.5